MNTKQPEATGFNFPFRGEIWTLKQENENPFLDIDYVFIKDIKKNQRGTYWIQYRKTSKPLHNKAPVFPITDEKPLDDFLSLYYKVEGLDDKEYDVIRKRLIS